MLLFYKNVIEKVNLDNLNPDELFDLIDNIPINSDDELELELEDDFENDEAEEIVGSYLQETCDNRDDMQVTSEQGRCMYSKPRKLIWRKEKLIDVPSSFKGSSLFSRKYYGIAYPTSVF